jgi:hypothetical protein
MFKRTMFTLIATTRTPLEMEGFGKNSVPVLIHIIVFYIFNLFPHFLQYLDVESFSTLLQSEQIICSLV